MDSNSFAAACWKLAQSVGISFVLVRVGSAVALSRQHPLEPCLMCKLTKSHQDQIDRGNYLLLLAALLFTAFIYISIGGNLGCTKLTKLLNMCLHQVLSQVFWNSVLLNKC